MCLPNGTTANGNDSVELRVSVMDRGRMNSRKSIGMNSWRVHRLIQFGGHRTTKSTDASVQAAINKCMCSQLTCVFDSHGYEHSPHFSLCGAIPWCSSVGDCSYPIKPVDAWDYRESGKWPDMTQCNLTRLQMVVAERSWYWLSFVICTEYVNPGYALHPAVEKTLRPRVCQQMLRQLPRATPSIGSS